MRKPPVLLLSIATTLLCAAPAGAEGPLIGLSIVSVSDLLANVQGGLRRHASVLEKLDFTATYLGDEHAIPGLTLFVDLQATDGTDFSGSVAGDAQAVSSIDAPAGLRLLDAWAAKEFGGRAGVKLGVIDLNSEFDVQQTAALFLNGARGIGADFSQSGANGPSIFPSTGFGIVGWWLPFGHWQVKAGAFEDTPGNPGHPGRTDLSLSNDSGALLVFELRNRLTPDFVVGGGTWTYTASGDSGAYAVADGALADGLSGWLRAGIAEGEIDATIGGGLVYTDDRAQLGISISTAHFRSGPAETSVEATYLYALSEALSLQPDIQYVVSPSGTFDDALVLGTRITAVF